MFMRLLEDRGIILDIGANLGIMTSHLLRKFRKAQIWAFEPIPENHKVLASLTENFPESRLIRFHQALGAEPGRTKMVLPEVDDVKMQGLSHIVHDSIEDFNEGRQYDVEVDTLDRMVGNDLQIEGIKLDVENFEYFVLLGGRKTIKRCKPVIYTELWENENRNKCFNFLTELGYTAKYYDGSVLKPFAGSNYQGQNFFFIPNK